MKFLKYLLFVLASIIVILIIIGLFLPSVVRVERTILIKAPVEIVFENVNNLHRFELWSPWNKLDSNMKVSYEGPFTGKGSVYIWKSNNKDVGNGKMTIIESKPYEYVKLLYDFGSEGNAVAEHRLTKQKDGVDLLWAVEIDMGWNLIGRFFGLFMDGMMGKDFENGLLNIKKLSEKEAINGTENEIGIKDIPIQKLYSIKDSTQTPHEIATKLDADYKELFDFLTKNKITCAGAPIAITYSYSDNKWVFDAAFIVQDNSIKPTGRIQANRIPACKTVFAVHIGSYKTVDKTYNKIMDFIKNNNLKIMGNSWEAYMNDIENTPEEKLITHIYFPVE